MERALGTLLADDFIEIGASGRVCDQRGALTALEHEVAAPAVRIVDFQARSLAPELWLATYRAEATAAVAASALRSSIWRHSQSGWRLVFHQGTPAPTAD